VFGWDSGSVWGNAAHQHTWVGVVTCLIRGAATTDEARLPLAPSTSSLSPMTIPMPCAALCVRVCAG
jgi:hypothetical protein